ncbi:hypothetical protein ACMVCI_003451 [Yersinia enterocolitica]|uniref:hypothetical protein n=1 Tax=Hafnia alvei TaxID=569 RepID=UPI003B7A053F
MFESIDPLDIYNKNINILIGSGASADLFPTLALAIKDANGQQETIETLATKFQADEEKKTALFMHYYNTCIFPVQSFDPDKVSSDIGLTNLNNYTTFLTTLLGLLDRRKDLNRKINIFTTNYDGCLSHTADRILMNGKHDFVINDGTSGFHKRYLHSKNFSTFQCQTGIFERSNFGIPQINMINLHGSVYWSKFNDKIEVDYRNRFDNILTKEEVEGLNAYSEYLGDSNNITENIIDLCLTKEQIDNFWDKYNKLPIVNPTKWKFHETVFEEHYYQMLRLLSYELEKPNSVLITFGFSFADEHILKLIQRSLSNPQLQTFICCYSKNSVYSMEKEFNLWRNVKIIGPSDSEKMDFTNFNKYVFSLKPEVYESPVYNEEDDLL